ncbi:UNVERIFIED_CONTAM: hypothetical protein FKN15_017083 [Acipenser sinensis]
MWKEGESEGLQTLGIVVVLCSLLKLLHFLGLIDVSNNQELERGNPSPWQRDTEHFGSYNDGPERLL